MLELDATRGAVYIIDTSSNGTFLNNKALPAKSASKVILSHGDDLVLKPADTDPNREFGWVVNMTEMAIKADVVMSGPRRLICQKKDAQFPEGLRR